MFGCGDLALKLFNFYLIIIYNYNFTIIYLRDEYDSDGSENSEDDARPLTRNELSKKVMKTVKKRESAARKEGFGYDLPTNREKSKAKKK